MSFIQEESLIKEEYIKAKILLHNYKILDIKSNSNDVQKGDVFVAISGNDYDGNNFIQDAINRGANLIITDKQEVKGDNIVYVDDSRKWLSIALSIIYPDLPKHLIAVTGTNGKTSTVNYIRQLLEALLKQAISIGNLGIQSDSVDINKVINNDKTNFNPSGINTLDAINLRKLLNRCANNNINYVAFEASSHGIKQKRLYNIPINISAFTSFSQDHLDYHKTMDDYLKTKLQLFTENLLDQGYCIINQEILNTTNTLEYFNINKINYLPIGFKEDFINTTSQNKNSVIITSIQSNADHTLVQFAYDNKHYEFSAPVIAKFQVMNLLIAVFSIFQLGDFKLNEIINHIQFIKQINGRMEKVTDNTDSFHIFVDFAHTPDALERVLIEVKKLLSNEGKLYVLFGCGGNRDSSKRSIMGKIACQYADHVIITDDNPRYEEASSIRKQIMQFVPNAIEIEDRKKAIINTINMLKKDDILVISGKGHEKYQLIKDKVIPMEDVAIAKEALYDIKK